MSSIKEYRIDKLYTTLRKEKDKFSFLEVLRIKNGIKIIKSNSVYTVKLIKEDNALYWLLKPYKDSYFMVKCKHDPDFTLLADIMKEEKSARL